MSYSYSQAQAASQAVGPAVVPPQSSTPQQQSQPHPLFGLLVPGRSLRTDFCPISPTQFTLRLSSEDIPFAQGAKLGAPPISTSLFLSSISEIVVTLFEPAVASLGPDNAVILYWQAEGSDTFETLGALTALRPSGIFRTGWDTGIHPALKDGSCRAVIIGASVESIEKAHNLELDTRHIEDRLSMAKKIAINLFNFMESFNTHSGGCGQYMTVPTNVLERWMKRFEAKYKIDSNFFMRS
uniref:Hikeshi-like C-terminal domain-containing protein n=1 Tax=Corethron hystrix TaxID=216773 RepID=A0A7S1B6R7_9STRA|mmetsp:Transcript_13560/g.29924  ORF Transcript_13560/g.29924 Transcript_13560/m.29924 type:complete len:240 (+) Transcript_13560:27-746(+)